MPRGPIQGAASIYTVLLCFALRLDGFCVDCSRKELLRKAVKTEAGWTFSALYAFLSLGSENELLDVWISSDEWTTVELKQPTELCVIFRKFHVLFRVVRASTHEEAHQNAFSILMTNARYSAAREGEERNQAFMPSLSISKHWIN